MIQNVAAIEKEFLIKTIAQNEQPVRFHGVSTIGTGLITVLDTTTLAVNLLDTFDSLPFSVCEHLTGYFDCHGKTYAFETTVRSIKSRELKIDQPVKLLKSLQRKYVRVKKPRGVEVMLHMANEDVSLDYPVCPEYISVEPPAKPLFGNEKRIPELVNAFRSELAAKCVNSNIVMFRLKKPEFFEESLICKTGKVLFIPSTGSGLPANDPYPEGRIITRSLEESYEDPNWFVEGSRFEKTLLEKRMTGVSSEIWCPIVYYQYVVGYVFVSTTGSETFDISMVDYLWDFSRILAFQLRQTGYFSGASDQRGSVRHKAAILDISPGGMLISFSKDEIRAPIRENSVFTVDIAAGKTTIACSARVCRRYGEGSSLSYGMSFTDLSSQDLMALYECLYRRPFGQNDPLAFEQNA
jgi:hypothetical protein